MEETLAIIESIETLLECLSGRNPMFGFLLILHLHPPVADIILQGFDPRVGPSQQEQDDCKTNHSHGGDFLCSNLRSREKSSLEGFPGTTDAQFHKKTPFQENDVQMIYTIFQLFCQCILTTISRDLFHPAPLGHSSIYRPQVERGRSIDTFIILVQYNYIKTRGGPNG